jgi:hypothetical protein
MFRAHRAVARDKNSRFLTPAVLFSLGCRPVTGQTATPIAAAVAQAPQGAADANAYKAALNQLANELAALKQRESARELERQREIEQERELRKKLEKQLEVQPQSPGNNPSVKMVYSTHDERVDWREIAYLRRTILS